MTAAEVKEYLGMAVELEKQVYLQNETIRELETRIQTLTNRLRHTEPLEPERRRNWHLFGVSLVVGAVVLAVAAVLGKGRTPLLWILVGAVVVLCGLWEVYQWRQQAVQEHIYQWNLEQYRKRVEQEEAQAEREMPKKEAFESDLRKLKQVNTATKSLLKKLYACNVIYPKYRNYVMVCSMYEYFAVGRCTVLEGPDGAYNLLESEIREKHVVSKLSDVLRNLEGIKENQWTLYDAIQESNRVVRLLINDCEDRAGQFDGTELRGAALNTRIEALQKTSAVTAYQTDCSRRESEYLKRMD